MVRSGIVWLACLAALVAAEGATVVLRPTAQVVGDLATLGDVADITGPATVQTLLAAITVQRLPDLHERRIEAPMVRALVRQAAPTLSVQVSGECAVSRTVQTITAEQLNEAASADVRTAQPQAGITIKRSAAPIGIPAGGPEPVLVAECLGSASVGEVPYRVKVMQDGREMSRALVVLQVSVLAEQLVTTRAIARGETIDAADVRLESRPVVAGEERLAAPDLVVGAVARRDLAEGATVSRQAVRVKPVVAGGQPVVLLYVHGEFALSIPATAMGDGLLGDQINVKRSTDGQMIRATVVGPGEVEIRP